MNYLVSYFDMYTLKTVLHTFATIEEVNVFIKPDWHEDVKIFEIGNQIPLMKEQK